MTDTHPAAAAVQLAVLRRLGPAKRLALAFAMSAAARALLQSRLRQAHPDWSPAAIAQELVRCAHAATGPGR
jgi:hypothetical protein